MRTLIYAFLTVAIWAVAPIKTTAAEPPLVAVWTPHKIDFDYRGFTTQYSCDGLRDKMEHLLLELGARKDLKVRRLSCGSNSGPTRFASVKLEFSSLTTPDALAAASPSGTAVRARWKTLSLTSDTNGDAVDGDCELMEQVRRDILPLFTTRKLGKLNTCIPHQGSIGPSALRLDVLQLEPQS